LATRTTAAGGIYRGLRVNTISVAKQVIGRGLLLKWLFVGKVGTKTIIHIAEMEA
jgi:hypothetical protein